VKKKYQLVWLIVGLIIFGLLFLFLRRKPVEIKLAPVVRKTLVASLPEEGEVKPIKEATLSFKTSGKLVSILNEGETVKTGTLLAQLSSEEARAQFKQAEANLIEVRKNYFRDQELRQEGIISQQQYQASATRFQVTEEEAKSARSVFEGSFIKAPFDGVIAKKFLEVGELINPGQPALIFIDNSQIYIEIQIDEVDIAQVKTGQQVTISADAYPEETFKGKIARINPQAELKRVGGQVRLDEKDMVFRAKVSVENSGEKLKAGMTVYVDIPTQIKENVLTVPREAVYNKDGKTFVFVVRGKRVFQKPVTLGIKSIAEIEITTGIKEGEKVATINLEKLRNKSRIKIAQKPI
jgi:HlyD family secretion protein/macrolide-specific efflux system membrane fusion protein